MMRLIQHHDTTQTVETYTEELERRLRRGLPVAKAGEIADEVRAHLHDATTDGAAQADLLQRFGSPRLYARRILGSAFSDPLSQAALRGAVYLGTALLLVAFLVFQFWLPPPMLFALRLLVWRNTVWLSLPITLFLLLAFVGRRAHTGFFATCGLVCLLCIGVDSGLHWTQTSYGSAIPKAFRISDAESPYKPPLPSAEPLLAHGQRVYTSAHPQVPADLRVGERFIVPCRYEPSLWVMDEADVFRQEPGKKALYAIYGKYRDADLEGSISESVVRKICLSGRQQQEEIERLEAAQPFHTVASLAEATARWRQDAPRLRALIQKETQERAQRSDEYKARYAVVPVFSWAAAGTRCAQFCGIPLGIVVGEIVLAWLGRTLWLIVRNRGNRRKRAA